VVIEPVQDLDIGAVSESPMGEVGLPGLVRLRCFEAQIGRTGALLRLRDDQARRVQDAPDRRGRRDVETLAFQMPGDRHQTRVMPVRAQPATQLDDPIADLGTRGRRIARRTPRSWFKRVESTRPISGQEPIEVHSADPVLDRSLAHTELLRDDLQDHDPMLRHARDCHLCRDSCVTYVMNPDTLRSTNVLSRDIGDT
jgi:hypothetical protein